MNWTLAAIAGAVVALCVVALWVIKRRRKRQGAEDGSDIYPMW